jgi:hypothetical protein
MALDYTELDSVINNTPGAQLTKPLFEEIKDNLKKRENGEVPESLVPFFEKGTAYLSSSNPITVNLTAAYADDTYHIELTPRFAPTGTLTIENVTTGSFDILRSSGSDEMNNLPWAVYGS